MKLEKLVPSLTNRERINERERLEQSLSNRERIEQRESETYCIYLWWGCAHNLFCGPQVFVRKFIEAILKIP